MNTLMLQQQFTTYAERFCGTAADGEIIFTDLIKRYNEPNRHYHTLSHVNTLLHDADTFFKSEIPGELFFAIWFHDAIYSSTSGKNEEHSAQLAVEALTKMQCSESLISTCAALIHKTSDHFTAEANDEVTRFFMDADLKILGAEETVYRQYLENVRKEYSSLPKLLFNIGRRKFLRKALQQERIFRTPEYFDKYEQVARRNLQNELNLLS